MSAQRSSRLKQIVLSQLKQSRGKVLLGLICIGGYAVTQLLAPWPLKIIFDYVLLEKPLPEFLSFLGGLIAGDKVFALIILSLSIVGIAVCGGGFSYSETYFTSRIGYELVHRLRRDLFNHLQRLSLSFHSRARSGELLTKVSSDTNALRDVFTESVLTFVVHALTLIGIFTTMFLVNWKLAAIVLGSFPVMFCALQYVYREIKASARRQRGKEGKIAARISEILSAVTLVQAFGRERYEGERFESASAESLHEGIRTARLEAAATRTVEIIGSVGSWAVILFGSLQALNGRMTPGDILIFAVYVNQVYRPIRHMVKLLSRFSRAMASATRIGEILQLEPEIADAPDAIEATHLKGAIEFRAVSFNYGDGKAVLEEVSFAIAAGERVALTGVSGAGKSTIVSLILRLYDPRAGAIAIDGVDVRQYQRESLRREIGVVLQDSLLLGATIRENIAYGKPDATHDEIEQAARQAHAHDFIAALPDGYESLLGERGATLSGGQRQRIALARALIKRPSILILDEPTSAIDAESERLIWDAIEQLQQGRTVLVIAHQLSTIKRCQRVLTLKDGMVLEKAQGAEAMRQYL